MGDAKNSFPLVAIKMVDSKNKYTSLYFNFGKSVKKSV